MKDAKYIIRKLIIGVGIALCFMFIKSCNVNAATPDFSILYNGNNLNSSTFYIANDNENTWFKINNETLYTMEELFSFGTFGKLAICSNGEVTNVYARNDNVKNISFYNTKATCNLNGTPGYTGNIIYIIFEVNWIPENASEFCGSTGQYCSYDLQIANYWKKGGYVQLINFNFSKEPFIYDDTNSTIINNQNQIKDNIDDINKNITDETSPNINGLQNSAGWLKPGPVDSIINLPLTLLNNLQTNLGNTCNPVIVNLPYVHKDISLPCISAIYKQIDGLDVWFQSIGVIAAAFILYKYFMYLYNRIDDTLSFRENNMQGYFDDSLWGGM